MKPTLRLAILATSALAAFIPLPASATGTRVDKPAAPGSEWWRLRPTDVATTGSTVRLPEPGRAPANPEARKPVRVVYPGLTDAR